jgi:DNA-binding CsgD family transcriptional regulator
MRSRRRGLRKSTRTNRTAHRRALSEVMVRTKIAQLRREWKQVGLVERGDRLKELVLLGCSKRGLAAELGIGGRTVSRHIEISALSQQEREAIARGASSKVMLLENSRLKRRREIADRIALERHSGKPSDEVAKVIFRFCRGGEGFPQNRIYGEEVPAFFTSVAMHLSGLGSHGVAPQGIPKKIGLAERFKRLRPRSDPDVFWLEHQAEWLAHVIWSMTQEQIIWETALRKVERRSNEF